MKVIYKRLLLVFGILILIGNAVYTCMLNSRINGIVVVDVLRVADEFKMKKDLELRVKPKLDQYTNEIDSLKAIFDLRLKQGADSGQLNSLAASIQEIQAEGQQAYSISSKAINEQIWQRLNTLITEYGQNHGYRLIIGANGMGTVLYNEKALDKTEDLIHFINEKYEKG